MAEEGCFFASGRRGGPQRLTGTKVKTWQPAKTRKMHQLPTLAGGTLPKLSIKSSPGAMTGHDVFLKSGEKLRCESQEVREFRGESFRCVLRGRGSCRCGVVSV